MNEPTIGEKVRAARIEKGFSQEHLAGVIGSPRKSVQRWEHDVVRPNHWSARRLALALEVPVEEFLSSSLDEELEAARALVEAARARRAMEAG